MGEKVPFCTRNFLVFLFIIFSGACSLASAKKCNPSGKLRGKKPPKNQCNTNNDSECCIEGKFYQTYECSPPVVKGRTKATLTLNSFEKGGDGGGPSECDGKFHSDKTKVVALSTGWLKKNNVKRCNKNIIIHTNGRSVKAKVVDECDSTKGCDSEHDFQPPCANNIVDASPAVWEALGVPKRDWGLMEIFWADA
ncbi:putative ripening-related protein 1 [Olea europaea var. sylvestris]|uniref:Ripening-related protein 1 n=1 Tax=Olea europaea subsp. europaea TaxID=158383 RepID=A0A8S0R2R3_OLEEU|nr:putative ripening-related protein 1 [Olea europaea var. sylvestris]CAA2973480.1 Hypothetical predicted protein [Olea europaea subsp. europaea]